MAQTGVTNYILCTVGTLRQHHAINELVVLGVLLDLQPLVFEQIQSAQFLLLYFLSDLDYIYLCFISCVHRKFDTNLQPKSREMLCMIHQL